MYHFPEHLIKISYLYNLIYTYTIYLSFYVAEKKIYFGTLANEVVW